MKTDVDKHRPIIAYAKVKIELDAEKGEMLIRLTKGDTCQFKGSDNAYVDGVCVGDCAVSGAVLCHRDYFNAAAEVLRDSFNQLNKSIVVLMNDRILMQGNDSHSMPFFDFSQSGEPNSKSQGAA